MTNIYHTFYRTLAMLLLAFIAGCGTTTVQAPPISDNQLTDEYRIGVGDTLRISVWRSAELSGDVPVRPDGKISMALVGDVTAAGQTTTALSNELAARLNDYIKNPQVTVIVTNPSSSDFQRRVRITGAINSPQSIAYRDGMTVLDLVLMAGGLTEFASGNKAKLYRKLDGEVKVFPVHLNDLIEKGELRTNYPLQPSDIVTVPERAF